MQLGAVNFIENMDRTTLTITDEEFEANVEAAVSAIAEKHQAESPPPPPPPPPTEKPIMQPRPLSALLSSSSAAAAAPASAGGASENKRLSLGPELLRPSTPRASTSSNEGAAAANTSGSESDDRVVAGLLRSIQRPLSTIGRMFSEDPSAPTAAANTLDNRDRPPSLPPQPGAVSGGGEPVSVSDSRQPRRGPNAERARARLSAEEAAARQASAEAAQARQLSDDEHANIVDTLASMFPDLDRDLISDVVWEKEGR